MKLPSSSDQGMDLRLDLCPPAVVTLIGETERETTVYLTDFSQSALQLIGDQRLPVNELICVELSDHLILADVKQCEERGAKFASDAVRLVTLPKSGVPNGANKKSKIEALIADFHIQCQVQLSTLQASIAVLDARAATEPEPDTRQKLSLPSSPKPPNEVKATEAKPRYQSELTVKISSNTSPARKVDAVVANPRGPQRIASRAEASEELDAALPTKGSASPKTFSEHMTVLGAAPAPPKPKRWLAPLVIAAAVTLVAGAAWIYGHQALSDAFFQQKAVNSVPNQPASQPSEDRKEANTAAEASTPPASSPVAETEGAQTKLDVKASVAPAPPAPAAARSLPTATQILEPKVEEVPSGNALLHASLKANQASWIAVCFDGKERFQRLLAAGATQDIAFAEAALVRLGNGPAVDVTFEGKPIERTGLASVVRTVELSSAGGRFVSSAGPSKACGSETASATLNGSPSLAN